MKLRPDFEYVTEVKFKTNRVSEGECTLCLQSEI